MHASIKSSDKHNNNTNDESSVKTYAEDNDDYTDNPDEDSFTDEVDELLYPRPASEIKLRKPEPGSKIANLKNTIESQV